MVLRRYLTEGLARVLVELDGMTIPVTGKEKLAQVAESVCYDPSLAEVMGEIFDIIGEYGHLEIRSGRGRKMEREYVEGMYWDGGLLSRELMITNPATLKAEVEDVAILISDLEIEEPAEMVALMQMAQKAGIGSLLVVARVIADAVIGVMTGVNRQNEDFGVVAVKTPGLKAPVQAASLEDMSILTGGRALLRAAGDSLKRVKLEDLGRARRAWANRNYVGVSGGQGDPRVLREHIATLRQAFGKAKTKEIRVDLQKRIGRLMGGSATLRVGGATESELKVRKDLAERTASALRATVSEGVVPGGGVALLACCPMLQEQLDRSDVADERAAYRILIETMRTPMRAIIENSGADASEVMAEVRMAGAGHGYDARACRIVDVVEAGIWDPAAVLKGAVRSGVAGAALALTTDVLVHHKDPAERLTP
jgi:chaperonin GroEL